MIRNTKGGENLINTVQKNKLIPFFIDSNNFSSHIHYWNK